MLPRKTATKYKGAELKALVSGGNIDINLVEDAIYRDFVNDQTSEKPVLNPFKTIQKLKRKPKLLLRKVESVIIPKLNLPPLPPLPPQKFSPQRMKAIVR